MKINISKKQYEVLIKAIEVGSFIYGPMSDMVDEKYKKDSDEILEDLELYDGQQMFENLAYELGKRDFNNKYSKEEIAKIKEEHGDYLGVPMYEFEKKYYDEINKNGYKRFYIKE